MIGDGEERVEIGAFGGGQVQALVKGQLAPREGRFEGFANFRPGGGEDFGGNSRAGLGKRGVCRGAGHGRVGPPALCLRGRGPRNILA